MDIHLSDRKNSDVVKLIPHRVGAALIIQRRPLAGVARKCKRSRRHLHFIVTGARPLSPYVEQVLRDALGPHWDFCTGKVDTLTDTTPAVEAQP